MTDEQRTARIAQLTIDIANYNASIESTTKAQSYSAVNRSKTMPSLESLVRLRDKAQAEKNELENESTTSSGIKTVLAVPRDY